jgi:acyl carrier protein
MDRTQLREILLEAFHTATAEENLVFTDETTLQDGLGLDSLGLVSVAIEVQDRLNIAMHLDEVRHIVTVGELLTLLEGKVAVKAKANAA